MYAMWKARMPYVSTRWALAFQIFSRSPNIHMLSGSWSRFSAIRWLSLSTSPRSLHLLAILTPAFSISNIFKPVVTIFYGCYTSRNRRKPIPLSLIPIFSTICILSLSPLVSQPPQASRQHLLNSNPFPYQILPFLQSLFFEAPLKRSTIP